MEEKDGQRQTKDGVGNPDRDIGTGYSEARDQRNPTDDKTLGEQLQQGHQRQLERHHLKGEDGEKDCIAAFEVKPGESVGGKHGEGNRKDHGGNRHGQAVEEVLEHRWVHPGSHE